LRIEESLLFVIHFTGVPEELRLCSFSCFGYRYHLYLSPKNKKNRNPQNRSVNLGSLHALIARWSITPFFGAYSNVKSYCSFAPVVPAHQFYAATACTKVCFALIPLAVRTQHPPVFNQNPAGAFIIF
jgi:hypothetical protein